MPWSRTRFGQKSEFGCLILSASWLFRLRFVGSGLGLGVFRLGGNASDLNAFN
jgi:hypothetical protein